MLSVLLPVRAGAQSPDRLGRVRYVVVDCRWELGAPGKGRELYRAAHVPERHWRDA